ncbi:hypothetical protein QWZ08_09405 [Ferruginibacter paludis]|uniref:hypothetical protein n=1 Tax=Ferruginibacter paludis TaxID=1310417 RepID=UPI0025B3AB95|nr:hypothetical protein [Ferruginibacter paludis]MDN3655839.1 hypothetical protein [Ferruginibacter paludis]
MTFVQAAAAVVMIANIRKFLTDFTFESLYFKFIFFLFMAYQLSILVRGIQFDYQALKYYFQIDYIFYPLIIPLIVFFNKDDLTFFYLIRSFYLLAVVFLLFSLLDRFLITQRGTAEGFILPFAFTCGFLFLSSKYTSRKITWVAFVSLLIGLLSFTYLARRNALGSFAVLLLTGFYFLLRNMHAGRFIRFIPIFCLIAIVGLSSADKLPLSLTEKLNDRLAEDSRSYVFDNFFKSMEEDMFFGRGMRGTYYSPIDHQVTDDGVVYDAVNNRDVIENGYLQLVLNGGYINVILFGLTLLPAGVLGLFKAKNQLTRICGIMILLWLVDMSVYGMPRLLLQYILVWMCVGICYKKSFRNKTDDEIAECFDAVGLN